jgi:hypothetical protein
MEIIENAKDSIADVEVLASKLKGFACQNKSIQGFNLVSFVAVRE